LDPPSLLFSELSEDVGLALTWRNSHGLSDRERGVPVGWPNQRPTRVLVSTSALRPETFKLLKASIVRGLFKRLQCLNVYVIEAGREFFAGMV